MRTLILISAAIALRLPAQDWTTGAFASDPNPISQIVQALVASKDDRLTPHVSEHNGRRYSYHLSSVRCLGKVSRDSSIFTVATVLFIRSSPEGAEQPPARGHGFLLLIDKENRISAACGLDFPDQVELLGTKLVRIGKLPFESERAEIGDLGTHDVPTRSRGFLIDGDAFLPYPFPDRIEPLEESKGEQGGAGQPATRSESNLEGDHKPQPESEGRSR